MLLVKNTENYIRNPRKIPKDEFEKAYDHAAARGIKLNELQAELTTKYKFSNTTFYRYVDEYEAKLRREQADSKAQAESASSQEIN